MNQKKKKETVEMLQKRLHTICMETCEEDIDEEEIDRIIHSIEEIHPLAQDNYFTPSASYKRFREKYLSPPNSDDGEVTDLIKQIADEVDVNVSLQTKFVKTHLIQNLALRRFVLTTAMMIVMFMALNLGTLATTKMNIFECIIRTSTGQEFLITGNTDAVSKKEKGVWVYKDVNDLKTLEETYNDILFPQYIPSGMEFSSAELIVLEDQNSINIMYNDTEKDIVLNVYITQYGQIGWQKRVHTQYEYLGKEVIEDKEVDFYLCDEETVAIFFIENAEYKIFGEIEKEEIIKILEELNREYNG